MSLFLTTREVAGLLKGTKVRLLTALLNAKPGVYTVFAAADGKVTLSGQGWYVTLQTMDDDGANWERAV
jgi:hypothetical protein